MTLIEIALGILGNILSQYKKTNAAGGVITNLEAAIASLVAAHAADITEGQLEGFRIDVAALLAQFQDTKDQPNGAE
jgi:chromate transport protein ChrA